MRKLTSLLITVSVLGICQGIDAMEADYTYASTPDVGLHYLRGVVGVNNMCPELLTRDMLQQIAHQKPFTFRNLTFSSVVSEHLDVLKFSVDPAWETHYKYYSFAKTELTSKRPAIESIYSCSIDHLGFTGYNHKTYTFNITLKADPTPPDVHIKEYYQALKELGVSQPMMWQWPQYYTEFDALVHTCSERDISKSQMNLRVIELYAHQQGLKEMVLYEQQRAVEYKRAYEQRLAKTQTQVQKELISSNGDVPHSEFQKRDMMPDELKKFMEDVERRKSAYQQNQMSEEERKKKAEADVKEALRLAEIDRKMNLADKRRSDDFDENQRLSGIQVKQGTNKSGKISPTSNF